VTHRPLVRLRARRDFRHEGRDVRAGEPLIVVEQVAARLLAAGDAKRDVTVVSPWNGRPALLGATYKADR
jgi:hypothetical protein